MKITIITATYNSAATVRDTLASVQSQNYPDIEHLIIDGASSDATLGIVREFKHVAACHSQKDRGIYDAMNRGISYATGDIVGILNSDDVYVNNTTISSVMQVFAETGADAVYGDLNYVQADDLNKVVRRWRAGAFDRQSFKWGWMPPHPSFFVKRELYEKFGKFNLEFRSAADYELMLRMAYKHQVNCAYLPQVLVKMRTGGVSNASFKNRIRANREDLRAWQVNDLHPYFFTLLLKPLRKLHQYLV
jgi:glycosyltransferase involved in cell wall biosynthesis